MSRNEKALFFRLGQILSVQGALNDKVLIFAKLKNPSFKTFERPYITVNINTFLCPVFQYESTLFPVSTYKTIFYRDKNYYEIDLKTTYANLKRAVEDFRTELNKNDLSNNYEYEIMSEQEFCSLY